MPDGFLSLLGAAQQKSLGKWIRDRYINHFKLLNEAFEPKAIKILSTDFNRTVDSARYNLLGMYGEDSGAIPITVSSLKTDYAGNPSKSCPRARSLEAILPLTLELQKLDLENTVRTYTLVP